MAMVGIEGIFGSVLSKAGRYGRLGCEAENVTQIMRGIRFVFQLQRFILFVENLMVSFKKIRRWNVPFFERFEYKFIINH